MRLLLLLFCLFVFSHCNKAQKTVVQSIIPTPEQEVTTGEFSSISNINFLKTNDLVKFGPWLAAWGNTKYTFEQNNNAFTHYNESLATGAYILDIGKDNINLTYHGDEGLKNGLSTLQQYWKLHDKKLPITKVIDSRPFRYRGMHLDVARHMFDVADIKKYIDFLAFYKYNYFHWHLTEDQGWRIEIKQYPKLQEIAAYRKETLIGHYNDQPHKFDGEKYGGYYKQEEIKDIVSYAMARGIEVIPEIDIPGHSQALLSAYPELGCENKVYEAATKWGVFNDVLCPNEVTFTFLENVLDELMSLFPSNYVHIGGDECPKDAWKKSTFCQRLIKENNLKDEHGLQSYFIQRVEKYINSKGRSIIGWDEILEGGLAPNATVMSWRGIEGGIEAANSNHDVIMTPTSHCYFDYYQSTDDVEPLAIGGYLPIKKVYNWDVIPPDLAAEKHQYILGGQANVWTEYMQDFSHVEYMALTRMATLSEVLWGRNSSNLDQFGSALVNHINYWQEQGVNAANHLYNPSLEAVSAADGKVELKVTNLLTGTKNQIKAPGNELFEDMIKPYHFTGSGEYKVQSTYNGNTGRSASMTYNKHLGTRANIKLKHQPAEVYSGSGNDCVLNGVEGSDAKYGGTEWLGFDGKDFDAEISFDKQTTLSSITIKTFKGEGQWIYLPKSITVYAVADNGTETKIAESKDIASESKIARTKIVLPSTSMTNIRIHVKNFGNIPEGKQGGGHGSWLFVDEVIIK